MHLRNASQKKNSRRLLAWLLTAGWLLTALPGRAQQGNLASLRAGHPRLLLTPAEVQTRRGLIVTDPFLRQQYASLVSRGTALLQEPALQYVITNDRLLDVSREAVNRLTTLGLLYQLSGEARWAEATRANLLAVSAFPDWHPAHFLDTGEMSLAVALGYDWVYDRLSAADRATIRRALVEKGLRPGQRHYQRGTWWTNKQSNWGQVCNGGLGTAALAIADEQPPLADSILTYVARNLPVTMQLYAPDGGSEEGLTYWNYGTRYNCLFIAAAQSALSTDLGLLQRPGFSQTGDYRLHMIGPLDRSFNYADQNESVFGAPVMLWLARQFNNRFYARAELDRNGAGGVLALLWYEPSLGQPTPNVVPLNARFDRIDVATLRSSWTDPRAWYVGFKAGDNQANHAHLDIGSFVLDANGQRWGLDLGIEQETYKFANGSRRNTYYRIRTEGHNTLTISANDQQPLRFANQHPQGAARITRFDAAAPFAITNMTNAYLPFSTDARALTRVERGIRLLGNQQVLVQDEVQASSPVEVIWNFHTKAAIAISGATATLTQGGETMRVHILAPAGAQFVVVDAQPPQPEERNTGVKNLTVQFPARTTNTTIAVRFVPAGSTAAAPPVQPLAAWSRTLSSQSAGLAGSVAPFPNPWPAAAQPLHLPQLPPAATHVTLHTLSGQLVHQAPTRGTSLLIPRQALPPGLYLLTIHTPEQRFHQKLEVSRE
ncbi:heparinase II/III domain-containing protein [Hymenobacter weizhouensis]|uniref:heparinase II/III domain-containing protein n=1 Tax=Hymenobacter sp. YIM 151500-1 TaxID=2987689 RepID=UPI002227FF98|nr:heparinase II/III family protein [Hymenobacter sp. YIM 151500-1]UYZ63420.1 heparinase II/III family protein [Hymenobacter sp. YIM 151500-1]